MGLVILYAKEAFWSIIFLVNVRGVVGYTVCKASFLIYLFFFSCSCFFNVRGVVGYIFCETSFLIFLCFCCCCCELRRLRCVRISLFCGPIVLYATGSASILFLFYYIFFKFFLSSWYNFLLLLLKGYS